MIENNVKECKMKYELDGDIVEINLTKEKINYIIDIFEQEYNSILEDMKAGNINIDEYDIESEVYEIMEQNMKFGEVYNNYPFSYYEFYIYRALTDITD